MLRRKKGKCRYELTKGIYANRAFGSDFHRRNVTGDIKLFCINRHNGHINSLFLDWSVRKIGLKELWTLRWRPSYPAVMIAHSPWTISGGVKPEDWPVWMRRFKDY